MLPNLEDSEAFFYKTLSPHTSEKTNTHNYFF